MADESEYTGPERRSVAIEDAPLSIKAVVALAALVAALVGWGIAWGTAQGQLSNKVDAKEQMRTDAAQDAKLILLTDQLSRMAPQVERTDDRVSKMYCSLVPANLKAGCK